MIRPEIRRILLSCFSIAVLLQSSEVYGQLDFVEDRPLDQVTRSGVALCVTDINGDLLDDVISFHRARSMHVRLQRPDGQGFDFIEHAFIASELWSVAAGDIDRDGHVDLLIGEEADESKVIWGPLYSTSTPDVTSLPGDIFFAQGSNLVDIDQDGFLDVFICNDNGLNKIWKYEGARSFSSQPDWIDFTTFPSSDNSGNYASLWSDLDDDDDIDLYISKCRIGVDDPEDPRRINQYFEQQNSMEFDQRAASLSLDLGQQSWAADVGDLDGDGDKDMVVINHDDPSSILQYLDGAWLDVSGRSGVDIDGLPVQIVLRDFDLDGDLDLLTTGERAQYFSNIGAFRFEEIAMTGLADHPTSMAVGDLNSDGILDLYVSYPQLFNSPSSRPDEILYGQLAEDRHWSILQLETSDQSPAIGSTITVYGPRGEISREVRSGHSYGIQNSLATHLGLGQDEIIDSIAIRWPDGATELIADILVDQRYLITQGACATMASELSDSPIIKACAGDSVWLEVSMLGEILWSDGTQTMTRWVTDDALLSARVIGLDGCIRVLGPVYVDFDPEESPTIEIVSGQLPACVGDVIILSTDGKARSYDWSTSDTTATIMITSEETVSVSIEGTCTDWLSEALPISYLDEPSLVLPELDSFDQGDDIRVLIDTPDSLFWFTSDTSSLVAFTGDSLLLDSILADTSFWLESCVYEQTVLSSGGELEHRGNTQYHFDGLNASMFFDCHTDALLHHVDVVTDFAGDRAIELWKDSELIFTKVITVPEGVSRLPLGWSIPAGEDYRLTTSRSQNIEVFGVASPRLWRNPSLDVDYPYQIGEVATITTSSQNDLGYYYFYDWRMSPQPSICCTDRIELNIDVRTSVSSDQIKADEITIYPVPASDVIIIESEAISIVSQELIDILGRITSVESNSMSRVELDVTDIVPGLYYIRLQLADGRIGLRQVIISR